MRQDSDNYYGDNYLSAQTIVGQLIHEYNHVRLHAALGYMEPREVHYGNPDLRREQLRQKLDTAKEQLRTVNRSIGFSRSSKREVLLPPESPDTVVQGLNRALDAVMPEVTARGGTVEKFIGNSALVVFRDADHTERALDACRAVLSRKREHDASVEVGFRISIAVDLGSIFYASVGAASQRRMDYTVLGRPVTNTIYLEAVAGAGQILVTAEIARRVADKFDFRPYGSPVRLGEVGSRDVLELVGRISTSYSGHVHIAGTSAAPARAFDETASEDLAKAPTAAAPSKRS